MLEQKYVLLCLQSWFFLCVPMVSMTLSKTLLDKVIMVRHIIEEETERTGYR